MKTSVNGTEIYYEIHGKEGAPWIVMSHSLACSVRISTCRLVALSSTIRIVAAGSA